MCIILSTCRKPKAAKRDRCAGISALDVARAPRRNQTKRLRPCGYPTECQRTVSTHEGRGAADGEGSLEESGSPATNGPMIKADKEAMQTAVKNLVEKRHPLLARTHHCGGRRGGSAMAKSPFAWSIRASASPPNRWTAFSSDSTGSTRPVRARPRFGTRLGHHQALRAGERRSDFGLVAYGGGVDVHHRAAGRPG